MKRSKLSKESYNMYNWRRKGSIGNGMELKPLFKEINRLKKNMTLNGIKEVMNPGQDSTQLSFQPMKRD